MAASATMMRAARGLAAAGGSVAAYKCLKMTDAENMRFSGPVKCELKGLDTFLSANAHTGPLPNTIKSMRFNDLLPAPANPKYKLVVIGFTAPGGWAYNADKCSSGVRFDTIPIANGVIKTGNSCDMLQYDIDSHAEFEKKIQGYDAFIVRVNPGQIDGAKKGMQMEFDKMMDKLAKSGKPVWSSPDVQTRMGAKDALVMIKDLSCGLTDTAAYYSAEDLELGFKKSCAFQPRVVKQNRGSAGEGIWLCWLQGKEYCKKYGDALLDDNDKIKLMEMNDNHIEYHTVGEFLEFCVNGPTPKAGTWTSVFPGQYLAGGKEAGGQLVDQRLLPRIVEGEVRMLMVKDTLFMIVHKIPDGGFSAVGGIAKYAFYQPGCPEFASLEKKFIGEDVSKLKKALDIEDQPLPLLWTADFIPKDAEDGTPGVTEYVVGEFNCSCVGISQFFAACGPDKSLADVSDENFTLASKLTDLMGRKAIEILNEKEK
jgi:hypothetical protein